MRVLHIDSSLRTHESVTRLMSRSCVDMLNRHYDECQVTYRDLIYGDQIPHLQHQWDRDSPGHSDTDHDIYSRSLASTLIQEIRQTEVLVIGAPVYNFSVPSQMKAYIDHICIAGETFEFHPTGPRGLLSVRAAIVLTARGGVSPCRRRSDAEYLRHPLSLIGISNVYFVHAERLNRRPKDREITFRRCHQRIADILSII